jgi:hypothetical protein
VAGGAGVQGDVPFTPEVYINGASFPICFPDDDSNTFAAAVCQAAGLFPSGAHVWQRTGEIFDKDALPVL